jgi:acyl-CoA synthetase (NDP forming)
MIASATADDYGKAIRVVAADPGIDALVVIFIPPLVTRAEDVARTIVDATRTAASGKPVVTVFLSARGVPDELKTADLKIPSFAFPEAAASCAGSGRALRPVARAADVRAAPI